MINNSFLLPAGQQWLKDGQAIVATTEDEGLWFSFDYGETWANVDLGPYSYKCPVMSFRSIRLPDNSFTFDAAVFLLREDGIVCVYVFQTGQLYTTDMGTGILDISFSDEYISFTKSRWLLTLRPNDYMGLGSNYDYEAKAWSANYIAFGVVFDNFGAWNASSYVLLANGTIRKGDAYYNAYYDTIYNLPESCGKLAATYSTSGAFICAFGSEKCFRTSFDFESYQEIALPGLTMAPYNTLYDRDGDAEASGSRAIVGASGVVYRSTDYGITFNNLFTGVEFVATSLSSNGLIEAIALKHAPLKVIRNGIIADALAAKNYTGVFVFKSKGYKIVEKPK